MSRLKGKSDVSGDRLETDRKKVKYLIGIPTKVFRGQKRIKPGDR